ncbi:CDP-6-deoxy-delta-3,4-glucoseen reductase [Allohahella marinimesophila]|uniref:FAD-binding FR-type domain-containing protein n=1 Tax=Allohahella marinimesophila TaxID=1054972 RepID=A0ABP7P7A2_9GAMM
MKTIECKVNTIERLSGDNYRVELEPDLSSVKQPLFAAGQYLQLLVPGVADGFFSIASAPQAAIIELHIEAPEALENSTAILNYLKTQFKSGEPLQVALPLGKSCLDHAPDFDIVLIAAGTGFAQMKSIIEFLHQSAYKRTVSLYWGVRTASDMYARSIAEDWMKKGKLRFVAVTADNADNEWQGHHAELIRAAIEGRHDWSSSMVFASGSPTMVYSALDALEPLGLPEDRFYSDVLEYAPRAR